MQDWIWVSWKQEFLQKQQNLQTNFANTTEATSMEGRIFRDAPLDFQGDRKFCQDGIVFCLFVCFFFCRFCHLREGEYFFSWKGDKGWFFFAPWQGWIFFILMVRVNFFSKETSYLPQKSKDAPLVKPSSDLHIPRVINTRPGSIRVFIYLRRVCN